MSGPQSPKAEPNEAELSRIAREAVHQPADPRLDRQLAVQVPVRFAHDEAAHVDRARLTWRRELQVDVAANWQIDAFNTGAARAQVGDAHLDGALQVDTARNAR